MKPNTSRKHLLLTGWACILILSAFAPVVQKKKVIYLIGDSTVRNTDKEQWGWGSVLQPYFDSSRAVVANHAMAGRSSRSFTNEGRFDKVEDLLKPGDYVLMQFGHNDGSYPDTTAKNRGTLKGTGEDTVVLKFKDGRTEVVHSYGWYIRQFVKRTQAKGAIPVVLSMIPRNIWKEGRVPRAANDFGKWAREVAEQEHAFFVDLNAISADKFDAMGPERVAKLFQGDHTHTNKDGAMLNAASVAQGIWENKKIGLRKSMDKHKVKTMLRSQSKRAATTPKKLYKRAIQL